MIHLVGLPHTEFDKVRFSSCAFTAKAVRTVEMLEATGREVTVYWGDQLMGKDWQVKNFGEYSADLLPVVEWDANLKYWREFNGMVAERIRASIKPGDIVALVGGPISQVIADEFRPTNTVIEPGVGYGGLCTNTFACFESYAWMHNRYGEYRIGDGRPFDAVIPNAVDPADWSVADSDGYALFVGRLIHRKGPHVAAQISKAIGLPLVMAGGGVAKREPGRITATDGTLIEGDHVTHIGSVGGEDRRWLYAHAEVLICPTLYIGPWEGVHAEALMSGVPVIAPDYGAFTETIPVQFRYRNLKQAVAAYHLGKPYRGEYLRQHAIRNFGIEKCTSMYDSWFDRLESLQGLGWYTT